MLTSNDISKIADLLRNKCDIRDNMKRLGYLTALLDFINEAERYELEFKNKSILDNE